MKSALFGGQGRAVWISQVRIAILPESKPCASTSSRSVSDIGDGNGRLPLLRPNGSSTAGALDAISLSNSLVGAGAADSDAGKTSLVGAAGASAAAGSSDFTVTATEGRALVARPDTLKNGSTVSASV